MDYIDYYKILGISKQATDSEIKKAYRKLAQKWHPDKNQGDAQAADRFKEINEAYQVLSDPQKRTQYDQFGSGWQQNGGFGGGNPWGNDAYSTRVEDLQDLFGGTGGFSDFFETLFGQGGTTQRRPRAGQNIEQPLPISLQEAYQGGTRRIKIESRQLEVKIPRGVKTGSKIRLKGEGMAGQHGGSSGDLYLIIEVTNNPQFTRQGDNLYVTIDVPMYRALLGGKVDVPTLDGTVKLSIPPETANGTKFRLSGKGMPKLKVKDKFGDLFATIRVELPQQLTDEERALFEELASLRGFDI